MKLKLTEEQYKIIEKYIIEARTAPEPLNLGRLFDENPSAIFFSIVSRLKNGSEHQYFFKVEEIKGHKVIKDINKRTKTKDCSIDANFNTMIYGNQFKVSFGKCGTIVINNVIAVNVYANEQSLRNNKPLDTANIEHEFDKTTSELTKEYNQKLKSANIGDVLLFDGKNGKYDGEVTRKVADKMDIELRDVKNQNQVQPKVLSINLDKDSFYEDNGRIIFKSISTKRGEEVSRPFNIIVKKFSIVFKPTKKTSKVKNNEPQTDDIEQLRSDGRKALEMILSDPNLKKAFYSQPSFLELLKAEITGKQATGKGIVPTLNIVGNYLSKKTIKKLGDVFINNKIVLFQVDRNVRINYIEKNKSKVFNLEKLVTYSAKPKPHEIGDDDTRVLREDPAGKPRDAFEIIVKDKTEERNVYLCDINKIVKSENQIKRYKESNIRITFLPSQGYIPETEQPSNVQFAK